MSRTPAVAAPKRICLVPRLVGVGGMVSFQHKLAAGLARCNVQVCYDLVDQPYQAVLVIGGTRRLGQLWRARRKGIRLVQRLDGMNWLHRLYRPGLRQRLRAEYGNLLLAFIRSRLAERVVYQSEFSRAWWERERGSTRQPNQVIYNGVDLQAYSPDGAGERPESHFRVLMVEGSLMGGYEAGLETAVRLAELLQQDHQAELGRPVELVVAGRVPAGLQAAWLKKTRINLRFAGLIPPEKIPELDRSAHLLYSADINAACPNSVIEALACGLPVAAYDTGALPELLDNSAGRIASYGGDPWQMEPPDIPALARAAVVVLSDQSTFRIGARGRAQARFDLDEMVSRYLEVLLE